MPERLYATHEHDFLDGAHLCQRQIALSRWENEGGAALGRMLQHPVFDGRAGMTPRNTELAQLHGRVIALENLLVALLSEMSDTQLDLAREMAARILPQAGHTPHPLTIRAAAHMTHLLELSGHFRRSKPQRMRNRRQ